MGGLAKSGVVLTTEPALVNGTPALVFRVDGKLDGVLAARVEGAGITGLYYVRNPEKLTRLGADTVVARS
jgi:RNA polymerase sigma-70 factor (ECF subfamily)